MEKAPDAFRTISEVADELDVPQHVLRFWESRFREIKPLKRGGNRRYYRPDDIGLLRGIRHLLYGEGYTIRGVQRILREQGSRFVQEVWRPGAAQPERDPGYDSASEEGAQSSESESAPGMVLSLPPFVAGGDGDRSGPSPMLQPTRRLQPNDRRRLEGVIAELEACRQLLDAALSER